MNGANGLEFLRFGSSIPGGYWGCCACCIIQNFKVMPTDKASMQVVSGDANTALTGNDGALYVGMTFEEMFETRIRIGTFSSREMPNHAFFAILTESQIQGTIGRAWLPILKRHGFEFLRTVCNSVYAGASLAGSKLPESSGSSMNHIFALFRNIGVGAIPNPLIPPTAWSSLSGSPEAVGLIDKKEGRALAEAQFDFQRKSWDKGKTQFYSEKELVAAGIPIWKTGIRGGAQPQNITDEVKKKLGSVKASTKASTPSAAPTKA